MIAAGRPASRRSASPSRPSTGRGQADAVRGQVLHQAQEPRQFGRIHALLVERQDEVAGGGPQREVAVLDPLGDAAEGDQVADVVVGQEIGEGFVGNFGVDGHGVPNQNERGPA